MAEWLAEAGQQQVLINLPPGDWEAGDRGLASHPERRGEFLESLDLALEYAAALNCPRFHCMAGRTRHDLAPEAQMETFEENLAEATARSAARGVTLMIEPLNPFDNPDYFLSDFGKALGIIDRLQAAGRPAPRFQFDIYHCQRIHGRVTDWIDRCGDRIAHYQISGTPDRHEPDVGDLPLAEILAKVAAKDPDLWIALEYYPLGETEAGLGWLDSYRNP